MPEKQPQKSFLLRLDRPTMDALERWAADEFRSVNGQLQWIVADAPDANQNRNQIYGNHNQICGFRFILKMNRKLSFISGLNRNDMSLSIDICKVNYFSRGNNKKGNPYWKNGIFNKF